MIKGGIEIIQYICIKKLTLNYLDEHEEIDETKLFEVEEGSVWERENPDLGEVRLIGCGENEYEWMEISKDILKHNFKQYDQIERNGVIE